MRYLQIYNPIIKTKSMFINTVPTNIRIDSETLETVDHYVYLGQLVDVEWGTKRITKKGLNDMVKIR